MFRLMSIAVFMICISFSACNTKKQPTRLVLDDLVAVGFFEDSVFDGLVSFYDKKSGRMVKQCDYDSGVENGLYKQFHPNGQLWIEARYTHGVSNGMNYLYSERGELMSTSYQYYGLPVGPFTEYANSKPKWFTFSSLNYESMLDIDYDSLGDRGLLGVTDDMIFLTALKRQFSSNPLYRLFLIQPPGFRFEYSLVSVDTLTEVTKRIRVFEQEEIPWVEFELDHNARPANSIYGIQLDAKDSIKGKNFRQFETISQPE